jgi:hypothetical protein
LPFEVGEFALKSGITGKEIRRKPAQGKVEFYAEKSWGKKKEFWVDK